MKMISLEELLLKLVAELPLSEFIKACKKAGLTDEDKQFIADIISSRGV